MFAKSGTVDYYISRKMDAMTRLKELRIEAKTALRELAKYTSIAFSTLSRIETGQREPTNEQSRQLANFFDVSQKYFLGESDEWIDVCNIYDGQFYKLNERSYNAYKEKDAIDVIVKRDFMVIRIGKYAAPTHHVIREVDERYGKELIEEQQVNFERAIASLNDEEKMEVLEYIKELKRK